MAWTELANRRTRTAKHYRDDTTGQHHFEQRLKTALHYPTSGPDSATLDGAIDMSPVRVNNAVFDGWRTAANDWHYAIGKDLASHGNEDGWIGFGGRQGAHWFKFRLERAGYLKWSTREWGDLGAVDYVRNRLTRTTDGLTIGPTGATSTINALSQARWNDIFPALPSGQVDLLWKAEGRQLKEEIIINQAAREWIAANRPPGFFFSGTPLTDVFFGFVFKLDWSDVPGIYRGATEKQTADDYDDGEAIVLKDAALNQLMAFMPVDEVYTPAVSLTEPGGRAVLRKRFYTDGGNHYLLVGVRCDQLNSLPAGDLIFDPTLTSQPDGTAGIDTFTKDDAADTGQGTNVLMEIAFNYFALDRFGLIKFDLSSIPGGSTIDNATLSLWVASAGDAADGTLTAAQVLSANSTWDEASTWNYKTPSTVRWAGDTGANGGADAGCSVSGTDYSATDDGSVAIGGSNPGAGTLLDITLTAARVQLMLAANYGWNVRTTTGDFLNLRSSDNATSGERPKLVVNYTEAAGTILRQMMAHHGD